MKLSARLVSVAAIAVVAAGCSAINPIITQEEYDASDGVSVEIGDVRGLNLLVITEAEGAPASLIGAFTNPGDEAVEVAVSLDGETIAMVEVPARGTVRLGAEGDTQVTGTSTAAPGRSHEITLQTDAAGQIVEEVPVFDGTLPEYAGELPA